MPQKINLVLMGMGVAGNARLKACENISNINLVGTISRRKGLGNLTFNQALNDSSLDAIAISTENTNHAESVEMALKAGKHVLVDYPLCFSYQTSQQLFDLAALKNKILHVEHIGLLSQAHLQAKEEIQNYGTLIEGQYFFSGGWNPKIADASYSGPLPFLAFSRLVQLSDFFGPFTIEHHDFFADENEFRLSLNLQFSNGGVLQFLEHRKLGLKRKRELEAMFTNGFLKWQSKPDKENLFEKDLKHFVSQVFESKTCYYNVSHMKFCIQQLANIPSNRICV